MESDLFQVGKFETKSFFQSQKVKAEHSIFIQEDQIPYVRYISQNLSTTGKYLSKAQKDKIQQPKREISKLQRSIQKNKKNMKYYQNLLNKLTQSYNMVMAAVYEAQQNNHLSVEMKRNDLNMINQYIQNKKNDLLQQQKQIQKSKQQINILKRKIQVIKGDRL